jgi:NAD-dependent deacetylase
MRKSSEIYMLDEICEIIRNGEYVVFFGGAGVSTDSGIPDFRGMGGLYSEEEEDGAYLMSLDCLQSEPERFFSFYRNHIFHPYA